MQIADSRGEHDKFKIGNSIVQFGFKNVVGHKKLLFSCHANKNDTQVYYYLLKKPPFFRFQSKARPHILRDWTSLLCNCDRSHRWNSLSRIPKSWALRPLRW